MDQQEIDQASPVRALDEPDPRRWKALALLASAFFMVILDATIVLTAVPSMQEDLGLSVSGVQWILTGYAVIFGGLMLFFGRVADLTGRPRWAGSGSSSSTFRSAWSSFCCARCWSGKAVIVWASAGSTSRAR